MFNSLYSPLFTDARTSPPDAFSGRKIRLLLVCGTLTGGGAERFVSNMLSHLDRSLFQLSLCLFRDEISYPLPADVDVSVLDHRNGFTTRQTVKRLRCLIESQEPDIVLSVMDYLGMFVGQALTSSKWQPYWIARTSNNPKLLLRGVRGQCRRLWLNHVYPRADEFVSNSRGLARSFEKQFPCSRGQVEVLNNPVDIGQLTALAHGEWSEDIDPNVPNLYYSARLCKQKRPDVLIEAFRLVLQHSPAKLWICGDGPLRRRIEDKIKKHKLGPHIRMLGFRQNAFPLLKAATLAVATSDYEGLPNNILEAQALGVPVVSTRSAYGPEEIIQHEKTGLLASCGNPAEVAQGIIRLLSDEDLRAKMSQAAREMAAKRFSTDVIMPKWEDYLLRVTNANTPWSSKAA